MIEDLERRRDPEAVAADRQRRKKVLGDARNFLLHFGSLVRQLMVHDPTNQAVLGVLGQVETDFANLRAVDGMLTTVFAEGHTFSNGVWVRTSGRAWETAVFLTDTLKNLNARGFVLDEAADRASILRFTQRLREVSRLREPVEERDIDIGIPGVRLLLIEDREEDGSDRGRFREQAVEVFREGLLAVNRENLVNLDVFMRRRQRSLVLRLVQMAEDSPEDLLALTTLRDPTLPQASHNLMVTILAIAAGRQMDLRRRDLVRLGVCALNHNVGESLLPPELFEAERELTIDERQVLEQHPLLGTKFLLEEYGFELPIVERAIASAEHHLHFDGCGYPAIAQDQPHLFSRIVAVSDVFNALASVRAFRDAYPPDQAMKLVHRRSGNQLDPLIVRTLIRVVGRYPPGSLVELDSGEYAVVLGPGRGAEPLLRPRVMLLTDAEGYELDQFIVVDLGERHPRRRAWLRTIVRTRDPGGLDTPVARFMFADRIEREPGRMDNDPT